MININMKKHLEKMSFLKRKMLPEIFLVTILRPLRTKIKAVQLMLDMEHQLQEVLMKSMVLLVSMRGARLVFHLLLWKEDEDQNLQQLLMEKMMMKTPKCVQEGPLISVCLCAR